jgi:hydroxyethylthiazole kinase-like uncharacterized protein yjeF
MIAFSIFSKLKPSTIYRRSLFAISVIPSLFFASAFSFHTQKLVMESNSQLNSKISYIDAITASKIDNDLMGSLGFRIDQLMELAGYSVACAAHDYLSNQLKDSSSCQTIDPNLILIFCGPGNNGGDGLVAARHLKHFGYSPSIIYPKKSNGALFDDLVKQCQDLEIEISSQLPTFEMVNRVGLIIDGLFGFSFKGPARSPFTDLITMMTQTTRPVLSIDIPSGWDVNLGDIYETGFIPHAVISLTLPKLCMRRYTGTHYVGGRFVPPKLAAELNLSMPNYGKNVNQVS